MNLPHADRRRGRVRPAQIVKASCRSGSRVEVVEHDPHRVHFVTNRQLPVLLSLAERSRTAGTIAYDWPGMSDGMARSHVQALYRKGLVEPDRFEHRGRTWRLSRRGREFVEAVEQAGWDDVDPEDGS